jgi:hypothetical protein
MVKSILNINASQRPVIANEVKQSLAVQYAGDQHKIARIAAISQLSFTLVINEQTCYNSGARLV